jgi:hypothetical protein
MRRSGVLRLCLLVPSVQIGGMTPGMLAGVDLAGVLGEAGVLAGEPQRRGSELVYPLALPDGVEVAIPVTSGQGGGFAAMLGRLEIVLGNDGGRLRLLVPNLPMVAGMVQAALAGWITDGPTVAPTGVAFWLRLTPGGTATLPLGMVGRIGVEVPG